MKNFKQQFKDFRSSTPKHIQWLLLAAAFIVVIILLTLLLGHKSGTNKPVEESNTSVDFKIDPSTVDLKDVEVGSSKNANINISVNAPVVIKDIQISASDITTTNNCEDLTDFCIINVIYKPTSVQQNAETTLKITWYVESLPDILNSEDVSVSYSSWQKEPEPEPEPPVVEPEPEPPVAEPEPPIAEPEPELPIVDPFKDAADEVRDVAVPNPFKEDDKLLPPEKCSEFAIPGYDQSGRQIGWIKPERGANYFHPFSDKDCSKPTGKYDFTTGIITSLEDGSKIGTDSDHIGYRHVRSRNLSMPKLSAPTTSAVVNADGSFENADWGTSTGMKRYTWDDTDSATLLGSTEEAERVISSQPYDRTFILRQFKPIPATIVSEVRADPSVYGCTGNTCETDKNYSVPVRATVDRNVYSDDGRTIILPTGTLLLGYLDGKLPGPYQAFGRMNIKWYQFIRPDGVEFNFANGQDPYSGDAQGRMGVPGHGSTDYIEQMVMPILTSLVPAAVNMIAPIADTVINQIDLDNNTIVQSGTIRSSEMAKQDVINTWNKITQKLLVDAIDNTIPPFSIAAGTRINVFSPVDLIVTCGKDAVDTTTAGHTSTKKCAFVKYGENPRRKWADLKKVEVDKTDKSWVGQVRSFDFMQYCKQDDKGKWTIDTSKWANSNTDYRTVLMYCESQNYQAINNAKQAVYNQSVQEQASNKYGSFKFNQTTGEFEQIGDKEQQKAYNTEVLGLTYSEPDEDGNEYIIDPFAKPASAIDPALLCEDGTMVDSHGCCTGETYTDNGPSDPDNPDSPHEFVCCPPEGECFTPVPLE